MSIAANAPGPSSSSVGAACLFVGFMESFLLLCTCTGDHEPSSSSPSPIPVPTRSELQDRADLTKAIGIWLLELFWDLEFGIWSFPSLSLYPELSPLPSPCLTILCQNF